VRAYPKQGWQPDKTANHMFRLDILMRPELIGIGNTDKALAPGRTCGTIICDCVTDHDTFFRPHTCQMTAMQQTIGIRFRTMSAIRPNDT
jgi:hypothetical protein